MHIDMQLRITGVAGCLLGATLVAVGATTVSTSPARAVPAFAEQTGQPCAACHVGGFGPQLTPFGRAFKLGGYTLRLKNNIPISAMAVASVTSTKRPQVPAPAGFSSNDNVAFDQGSLFLAGGVGSHLGGFAQFTYDGVGKAWSWDNLDLRAVNAGKIGGKDLVYGLSLNNSPSVQDVWNTLPAWGYPYTSSGLAPSPANGPLIAGGLAQNVLGLTAYAWIDSKFYVEAGGYSSPRAGTLRWLGADPADPGDIQGIAPYVRVAIEQPLAGGTFELGGFLLKANIRPGLDRSTTLTNRYTDAGVDASWLKTFGSDTLTVNARYTNEHRSARRHMLPGHDGRLDSDRPCQQLCQRVATRTSRRCVLLLAQHGRRDSRCFRSFGANESIALSRKPGGEARQHGLPDAGRRYPVWRHPPLAAWTAVQHAGRGAIHRLYPFQRFQARL